MQSTKLARNRRNFANFFVDTVSPNPPYSQMAIQYQTPLDRTFHALGDGTRREILAMLATRGACTANEIRAPFDAAQPTISKHLKVLETAGLVKRDIDGRHHRFELQTTAMNEAEEWINRHRLFWEATLERLSSFLEQAENPSKVKKVSE